MNRLRDFDLSDGFTAEVAVAGDYYKLTYNGVTIFQDSACSDCYDADSAEGFFEMLLDDFGEFGRKVIKRAIDDFGYKGDDYLRGEDLVIDAENHIFERGIPDKYEYCELTTTNRGQHYDWNGKWSDGEIFDFSDRRSDLYYKDADFNSEPVNLRDAEYDEENDYAFLFDFVLDDDANLVGLYDYLDK